MQFFFFFESLVNFFLAYCLLSFTKSGPFEHVSLSQIWCMIYITRHLIPFFFSFFLNFCCSNETYNGEANGISDSSRDAVGLDGWRSTRDRSRRIDNTMNDAATRLSRRTGGNRSLFGRRDERGVDRRDTGNGSGQYSESEFDLAAGQTATLRDPFLSEAEHSSGAPRADKALNKRLKKFGSSSRNHGDCSTSISEYSDVMFLGSSRESMNLRSSTGHHPQSQSGLGPLIDVDAFSPPAGLGPAIDADAFLLPNRRVTQSSDSTNNDDSEARARQVEADEILARELQEQLYHETPLVREDNVGFPKK